MAIEKEDVKLLTYPFPAKAHKFANDMPYIHEEIINDRLDMVDPNWELKINRVEHRANAGAGGKDVGTVWVHVTMTVKGVSRDEIGMAVIQQTNPNEIKRWNDDTKKNEGTGKFYTSEANEAEKAATTDAMKRAARKFGIGRYLLAIPKVNSKSTVTNVTQMEKWLKDTFGEVRELSLYYDDSDGSLFGDSEEIPAPAPAPASKLEPEAHGLGDNILTTPEIRVVDIKKSDTGKIYIVAGGITFFSRDPFRALGFPKEFIDKMEVIKNGLYLPVPIRIAYTEITVGNQKQRTPISVMRTDTELEVQVKARQTA